MGLIQNLLSGYDTSDLERIAVGTGPGNFTGIRVGVATGKGLALGLGRPLYGITRFEAAAAYHLKHRQVSDLPYHIIFQAGRRGYYVQRWENIHSAETARFVENIQTLQFEKDEALVGDIEVLPEELIARVSGETTIFPNSEIAASQFDAGHSLKIFTIPAIPPVPYYIRRADAAPSRISAPEIIA